MFEAQFFRGNRQALRRAVSAPLIVISAHGRLQRSADITFPFYQDNHFWYLTGLDEPDAVLVMDGDDEYLIVAKKEAWRVHFEGDKTVTEVQKCSGVREVLSKKAGWQRLKQRLVQSRRVGTCAAAPAYLKRYGFYTNPSRAQLIRRLKRYQPRLEIIDVRSLITRQRMVKQTPELKVINRSIKYTIDVIKELAKPGWHSYESEFAIATKLQAGFRDAGADGEGFESIVAAGKNAYTIHPIPTREKLPREGLLLLDVGAGIEHYTADISRTYALAKPTKRQQEVYDAVLAACEYAQDLLKPGTVLRDYELEMRNFMAEKLRQLGVIKKATKKAVQHHFPHMTSHHLGLDPHDAADYEQPLEPGMVLTIEPGIYLAEEGIGVRIEDDLQITNEGIKLLTGDLPRSLS